MKGKKSDHYLYFTRGKQSFRMFGSTHEIDPKNSQFLFIKKIFQEFLDDNNESKLVIAETSKPEFIEKTYDLSIQKNGEAGATYYLAAKHNIPSTCPEPTPIEQREGLCSMFSSEMVVYSLVLQNLAAWFRNNRDRTFAEVIDFTLKREVDFGAPYSFDITLEWFEEYHKKVSPNQKIQDELFLMKMADPRREDSEVNKVIHSRTKIRNEFILNFIKKSWNDGNSLFIVYGRGHFDVLRGELLKLR